MTPCFTVRPAEESDIEFVFHLMKVALGPHIIQTWDEFDDVSQRARFDKVTRVEDHKIVEASGKPIGCICALEREHELHIVRIFLVPEYQRRGIGTRIVADLLLSARKRGVPARLRVLKVNPARRLYERLGFDIIDETETDYEMRYDA